MQYGAINVSGVVGRKDQPIATGVCDYTSMNRHCFHH